MKKISKKTVPLLLSLALVFTLTAAAATDSAQERVAGAYDTKEEVIYARLNSDGTLRSAYGVNILNVTSPGLISDPGVYDSVVNLTTVSDISQINGEVVLDAPVGRFYYQGNMTSCELPWLIDVRYYLDGAEISAAQLAGQSGELKITIATAKNENAASEVFWENYMLQISLTLDTARCSSIICEEATVANSGRDKLVTITALPGASHSYEISCRVNDFEMDGIQISGIPMSMSFDIPSADSLKGQLEQLEAGIKLLDEGAAELAGGFTQLVTGAQALSVGSAEFSEGLKQLSANSGALTDGSAKIHAALKQINDGIEDADFGLISQYATVSDAIKGIADRLGSTAASLTSQAVSYASAYRIIKNSVNELPDYSLDVSAQLASDDPDVKALAQAYSAQQTAIRRTKAVFERYDPALSSLSSSLTSAAAEITAVTSLFRLFSSVTGGGEEGDLSAITELAEGLSALYTSYGEFDAGLREYTSGVDKLSTSYVEIDAGIASLAGGVGQLSDGADRLSGGLSQLAQSTDNMGASVDEAIAGLASSLGGEFEMTSFVSPDTDKTEAVQFVFATDPIAKPQPTPVVSEEEKKTFWQRLLDLFR